MGLLSIVWPLGTSRPMFYLFGLSWFAYVDLESDLLVWSNPTSQSGGQPFRDTSPFKVSEYSIAHWNQCDQQKVAKYL